MKPIPSAEDPLIYSESAFISSEFVIITSDDIFDVSMQYPTMELNNSEPRCMLRKEAYDKLLLAAKSLPDGYRFRIWDAWRPFALQAELFDFYSKDIIKTFHLENLTKAEQDSFIKKFVSLPTDNPDIPPVHTTGGAIDLTIIGPDECELAMGTAFDAFTDKTQTDWFEINNSDDEIRQNRRLLYNTMISAGFTNLPSEWWHFDYGDRFWAYYKNKPALYRGVFDAGLLTLMK